MPIDLKSLEPHGLEQTINPSLLGLKQAATQYNKLAPNAHLGHRRSLVMTMVRCIGKYITHQPERDDRWRLSLALGEVIEQLFEEARRLRIALLATDSDLTGIGVFGSRCYWLELVDEKHRPGFELSREFDRWNRDDNAKKCKLSFWRYLDGDTGVPQAAEPEAVVDNGYLQPDRLPTTVSYAEDPAAAASSGPHPPALVFDEPPRPAWLIPREGVTYLDADSGEAHRFEIRFVPGGLLMEANSWLEETFDSRQHFSVDHGKGWAIFVASPTERLYAGSHIEGKFHHSTFLAGRPVMAAGEILADRGRVLAITCQSGHYQPTPQQMQNFVVRFQEIPAGTLIQPRHDRKEFVRVGDFRKNGGAAEVVDAGTVRRLLPAWADKHHV